MSAAMPDQEDLERIILLALTFEESNDLAFLGNYDEELSSAAIDALVRKELLESSGARYALTYKGLREQLARKALRKKLRHRKGA